MPVTYDECGPDEYAILGDLKLKYRDDLAEAKARIALFFVFDSEYPNIPALMVRGKAARGSAKVNSVGDRAEGKADATIRLDRASWERASHRERVALVHHELSHIGCPNPKKTDSLGRPVLRPVHADWETDGFDAIVEIYGEAAPEKINLNVIRERLRQQGLPLDDGPTIDIPVETAVETAVESAAAPVVDTRRVSSVEISMGGRSVTLTNTDFPKIREAADMLRARADGETPADGETEAPEPSDRWRSVLLSDVCKRLGDEAWHTLNAEYELRTLEDVADFLRNGERLHELPLLGLDSAAILAEDIDIYRCDQGGAVAQGIDVEWLADTLAVYRDHAIEQAKVKNPSKSKSKPKPKAQATA